MITETQPKTLVHIRWLIRRDMPEVLAIEAANFEFPWPEEDFVRMLRQRNNIAMVAEVHERIVGYMVYGLLPDRIHLYNIATASHGRGVGRQLIDKLKGKVSPVRRNRIVCEVRETNLDACLFFKALGFRAVKVLKDFYEDTADDAYLFRYRVRAEATA